MRSLIFFISYCMIISCVSISEMVKKRNEQINGLMIFNYYKLWSSLDIFRFKHNIKNVKIGIVIERVEDRITHKYDNLNLKNMIYNDWIGNINSIKEEWEKIKIEYFSSSEIQKNLIYLDYKNPQHEIAELKNEAYSTQVEDIASCLAYFFYNSSFYNSKMAFEDYLKSRTFLAADLNTLKDILGEHGLSQAGLTNNQIEQLKLHEINFLLVISVYRRKVTEPPVEKGYLLAILTDVRLFYVKTSEIITTAKFVRFASY